MYFGANAAVSFTYKILDCGIIEIKSDRDISIYLTPQQ